VAILTKQYQPASAQRDKAITVIEPMPSERFGGTANNTPFID